MRFRNAIAIAVALAFLLSVRTVRAEPLLQVLPDDGAWATFHVNLKIGEQSTNPTWTLRSVGKKQVGGAPFRWVELHSKEDDRNIVLFKCLVPESEFGKGKDPLASAQQVFVKYGQQEPREVQSVAAADPVLSLILAGPAELKKLDEKESVELQKGRVECDVFLGISKTEIVGAKVEIEHRLLMSDEVPYRLAAARFRINAELAGNKLTGSADCILKETGKDAKSELPEIE